MDNRILSLFIGIILISGISSIQYVSADTSADELGVDQDPVFYSDDDTGGDGESDTVDVVDNVIRDPNAGPWIKHLDASLSASPIKIHEVLTVTGPNDWCDWHEAIDQTPGGGGGYTSVVYNIGGGPIALLLPPGGVDGPPLATSFDLVFDPCLSSANNDVLDIRKNIDTPIAGATNAFVQVREWPTNGNDNGNGDRTAVGGEIIPLDSTMVLVAGTHSVAAWMIPVIVSAIGIGIVIARKF